MLDTFWQINVMKIFSASSATFNGKILHREDTSLKPLSMEVTFSLIFIIYCLRNLALNVESWSLKMEVVIWSSVENVIINFADSALGMLQDIHIMNEGFVHIDTFQLLEQWYLLSYYLTLNWHLPLKLWIELKKLYFIILVHL